jgi:Bacterial PH domain
MKAASRKPAVAREHEFEAQHGLPERLPEGERILWQGAPDWRVLARRVFHADKVAAWFAVLLAWRMASVVQDGGGLAEAARAVIWSAPLFALAVALLLVLARWSAASTCYTLTDRRVAMRIGIVLTVTYNLPLARIDRADLHALGRSGHGDIALVLEQATRIAWLHLWPHARPWHVARPQPMLRALPDAARVSELLAGAWSAANRQAARPAVEAVSTTGQPAHPALATH